MRTYLDVVAELFAHEEYRSLTVGEQIEECVLIAREFLDEANGVEAPADTFGSEEHDAIVARARKHRRAMKKSKHDVCFSNRKWNLDEALRERGFKAFPYRKGDDPVPYDRLDLKEKLAKAAQRDFTAQMRELEAANDEELPNIFAPTSWDAYETARALEYIKAMEARWLGSMEELHKGSVGITDIVEGDIIPEDIEQICEEYCDECEEAERDFNAFASAHARTLDKNRARRRSLKKEKRGGYHTGAQYKKESMFYHTLSDARTREETRDFNAQMRELEVANDDDQVDLLEETPIVENEVDPDDIEFMKGREEKSSYEAGYNAGYEAGYRAAYAEMLCMTAAKLQ